MTIGDWIVANGNPSASRSFGGIVPAYPIFMFIGILAVIIGSIIKMRMKKIPLRELEIAIFITVPIGLIGGSIFGKAFIPNYTWYKVFFFWNPGMSLFGALGLGTTAGFIYFYKRSKVTFISVWVYADAIIPMILLGQAIGRWGNLYNHEILGNITSYESLSWIGNGIRDKLFYFPDLSGFNLEDDWWNTSTNSWKLIYATSGVFEGQSLYDVLFWEVDSKDPSTWLNGIDPNIYNYGTILYRQPLFFYESISCFFAWIIITFGIANIGRFFSKPKPWDLEPKAFPGWYNKSYKTLPINKIKSIQTIAPIKYKKVIIKNETGEVEEYKLGFYQAWNKAYYWYLPDESKTRKIEIEFDKRLNIKNENLSKLKKAKSDYKKNILKIENNYKKNTSMLNKNTSKYKSLKNNKIIDIQKQKEILNNKKQDIYNIIGDWKRIFNGDPIGSIELNKLHNPNNYIIVRSGVLTGAYIFLYMLIRIVLEVQRKPEELFIQNSPIADFVIMSLILLSGIIIMAIAQLIAPYKYREVNWLYEKSY